MHDQAGRISGTILLLLAVVVLMFLGGAPLLHMLHATGALPSYTPADVATSMEGRFPGASFRCQHWVDGWDFVCFGRHIGPNGEPYEVKYGVQSGWRTPVVKTSVLPSKQPTPARKVYVDPRYAQAQSDAGKLNLNTAGEDRLRALPGLEPDVVRQIVLMRMHKPFERVDDLLKIDGVDRETLERIRPYVRVGKR